MASLDIKIRWLCDKFSRLNLTEFNLLRKYTFTFPRPRKSVSGYNALPKPISLGIIKFIAEAAVHLHLKEIPLDLYRRRLRHQRYRRSEGRNKTHHFPWGDGSSRWRPQHPPAATATRRQHPGYEGRKNHCQRVPGALCRDSPPSRRHAPRPSPRRR